MKNQESRNGRAGRRTLPALATMVCMLLAVGCQSGTGSPDFAALNPLTGPKPAAAAASPGKSLSQNRRGLSHFESSEQNVPAPFSARGFGIGSKPKPPDGEFAARLAQAQNLERASKLDEARAIYEELVAKYPDRYQSYHRLAVVADRQRRFREAEALYSEAIRLQPLDPELFNDLGYCLFLQGNLGKAEAAGLKAVALAPSNPRFRNNLGMILAHQGRHEQALEQFRQAGSEADAMYNLAFVLAAKNDVEGAKNCFRLALAADPTYEPARKALESFERFEANPHEAAAIAANGVRWVPYTEGSDDRTAVRTASQTTPVPSGRLVPSTRPETQSQLKRARTMMAETIQPRAQ